MAYVLIMPRLNITFLIFVCFKVAEDTGLFGIGVVDGDEVRHGESSLKVTMRWYAGQLSGECPRILMPVEILEF